MITPFCLLNSSTTGYGNPMRIGSKDMLFRACLDAAGGTATCKVYTRLTAQDAWYLRGTFSLSGANDAAELLVTGEPWAEARGQVEAISGTDARAMIFVGC